MVLPSEARSRYDCHRSFGPNFRAVVTPSHESPMHPDIVHFGGIYDTTRKSGLEDHLMYLLGKSEPLYLDFSEVSHFDSSGLASVVIILQKSEKGRPVYIVNASDRTRKVFELAGFLKKPLN